MWKKGILFLALVAAFTAAAAEKHDVCGFDRGAELLIARDPAYLERVGSMEAKLAQFRRARSKAVSADKCVPVVVHVIHANGPENIPDYQIYDAIRQLNEDFGKLPATPGFGAGVDTHVQFHLAAIDPNGNPTSGIVRVGPSGGPYSPETYHTFDGGGPGELATKNLSRWPNDRYLNIWVVKCINGAFTPTCPNAVNTTYGYAYLVTSVPGTYAPFDNLDGVVIRADRFGRSGLAAANNVRVLTHEVGHWLNLYHTFGAN